MITDIQPLLNKYNIPVPRYTSYPTVPYWTDGLDGARWKKNLRQKFSEACEDGGISLYLHLPFCESLCTYCGCNKKITSNHQVEQEYMGAITREWDLYRQLTGATPLIRELHLGGGTPTFFSPGNLARLLEHILGPAAIHPKYEFSIEGHPNNTTHEHLQTLYGLGFRRISYGVQDNDPEVQRLINRHQPFEKVAAATEMARAAGFRSVNFDLIYGLPRQSVETMERTLDQSISLRPDRVAFYSYAHVPWTSRGQRLFDEQDLPGAALKMELYLTGKKKFAAAGYTDIGMDHFALPGDSLYEAWQEGWLHRNFMGYTTQHTSLLLGLGVSAISDAGNAFAQNEKSLHDYYQRVSKDELPVTRGYFLSDEDLAFRQYILAISCQGQSSFRTEDLPLLEKWTFPALTVLEADGLLSWDRQGIRVSQLGRQFIRNICSAFDLHLLRGRQGQDQRRFSQAI